MTEREAPPAVFDDAVVESAAAAHGIGADRLAALLADHQAGVEELPGVENLVYEWRKRFDGTVLERTETAYYVAAPPWVWDEFAERLDAEQVEVTALADAHERQVRARVDDAASGGTPLVLARGE